ncbi:MAG TPA: FAD-dependent oxidoreductase [Acidobacteriaceae bacterium]|jgi:monoamine oxidase
MGFTRRDFLMKVGNAGGYSAAFLAMQGLGLVESKAAAQPVIEAAPGSGKGTKVVVLGGGIAGLVAAYELRALGYEVTVLEARSRPGGRNWTVRGGDKVTFTDGTTQQCTWQEGHYQNFGPARLPSIHPNILGYCRKLGVELQVEVNMTNSAHLQNDNANDGKPEVMRRVVNDARGHVSELLMKCMNTGALDADFSGQDRDKMLAFLRMYGPLDSAGKYVGSDRAGYVKTAGAGDETGVLNQPIDMHTLLDENFWQGMMFDQQFDMQATMFQPVGGMDRIPYAFAKSLGSIVKFDAPVTEIRKTAKGVKVSYKEKGAAKMIEADYCMCAMPLTILKTIPNDFSEPYQKVIAECTYASAYKVAWESRRFWEQDYNIYGGLEFCSVGCSPIWFPSASLFADRGVVVSGYTDETNSPFGKLSIPEKFEESRKSIERLHPGHGKELEKPMYVGWGKVPYNEGSWIRSYSPNQPRRGGNSVTTQPGAGGGQAPGMTQARSTGGAQQPAAARTQSNPGYDTLTQPDGRVIFIGDHVSHIVAWQEGAAVSALRGVKLLSEQVKAARLATTSDSVSA